MHQADWDQKRVLEQAALAIYTARARSALMELLTDPSDELVKMIAGMVHTGQRTPRVLDLVGARAAGGHRVDGRQDAAPRDDAARDSATAPEALGPDAGPRMRRAGLHGAHRQAQPGGRDALGPRPAGEPAWRRRGLRQVAADDPRPRGPARDGPGQPGPLLVRQRLVHVDHPARGPQGRTHQRAGARARRAHQGTRRPRRHAGRGRIGTGPRSRRTNQPGRDRPWSRQQPPRPPPEARAPRVRYVTTLDRLEQLNDDERRRLAPVAERYAFRLNDYYAGLIDWSDPEDPIRRLVVPDERELADYGALDASDEEANTVARGVQHKYADTALLLCNEVCGAYCRYCFRKRLFMNDNDEATNDVADGVAYIAAHPEITNVCSPAATRC